MFRSAASRLLSSARSVARIRTYSSAPAKVETECEKWCAANIATNNVSKLDDKFVTPSATGVKGPDAKHLPGQPVVPEGCTSNCCGHMVPGAAWSDGKARIVWDEYPSYCVKNTTIIHTPAKETDEEMDARYINYLSRPDLDGWELRKILTDLHREDMVPEPAVAIAAFQAIRRLNEFSLAVRFLECLKNKCGPDHRRAKIWPWLMQEIGPTLQELGIPTLEELGYDKPELWKESVYDM